jgi:predicted nucleic acid-binding protein
VPDNGILADTSIWIEFFRPGTEAGNRLEKLLAKNSVWICGTVLFELVQGVRSDKEKKLLLDIFLNLPYVEMTSSLWRQGGELSATLKKKGVTVPFSDILIASVAIEHNLRIFTFDKHFEQIPGVKIYRY